MSLLALAVIFGLSMVLVLHKKVSVIPAENTAQSASKNNAQNSTDQIPNQKSSSSTGYTSPPQKSQNSATVLLLPSGTLVSNHRPSLSGGSSPSSEQSVCNTSSGAVCYIQFEKGNEVKKLPAQNTDSNGSAYWTWDISQAGLSVGSWKITAVATKGGETKTFSDSLTMDVQP